MEEVERGVAHVAPDEGKAIWLLGELFTIKAASEDTGGAFTLFDTMTAPQAGPPPHYHRRQNDSFYVLEGEFEFLDNDRAIRAGVGSFVYIPKGNVHAYKCVGAEPGRLLALITPGGFEKFFEEAGEPAKERTLPPEAPPDFERILEISRKHDNEFPPLPENIISEGVVHVPPGGGKKVWMVGTDLISFKVTGEETGGAFALLDSLVLPGGGPPPHIHTREAEGFYVLEGEFEFLVGDRWIQASPGSFVHVPKGTLHTLKNVGLDVGRLLTLILPAGLERFFEELGVPGTDVSSPPPFGPAEIENLLATAPKYGIEVPPLPE